MGKGPPMNLHREDELDTRLAEALRRSPAVEVPSGFARRVAEQVAREPRRSPRGATPSWGVRAAWGSTALLLAAMFGLALHAQHAGWGLVGLQTLYMAELAAAALGVVAAGRVA
jgi:hypothetical protein